LLAALSGSPEPSTAKARVRFGSHVLPQFMKEGQDHASGAMSPEEEAQALRPLYKVLYRIAERAERERRVNRGHPVQSDANARSSAPDNGIAK
jgi:hypothetical protein